LFPLAAISFVDDPRTSLQHCFHGNPSWHIHAVSADPKGKLMEDDETNVHSLNLPKDADAAATDKLVRQAPSIAKMKKALFDAYVAEGFTVDQAIKLLCM
jgi:hypothetical protein